MYLNSLTRPKISSEAKATVKLEEWSYNGIRAIIEYVKEATPTKVQVLPTPEGALSQNLTVTQREGRIVTRMKLRWTKFQGIIRV